MAPLSEASSIIQGRVEHIMALIALVQEWAVCFLACHCIAHILFLGDMMIHLNMSFREVFGHRWVWQQGGKPLSQLYTTRHRSTTWRQGWCHSNQYHSLTIHWSLCGWFKFWDSPKAPCLRCDVGQRWTANGWFASCALSRDQRKGDPNSRRTLQWTNGWHCNLTGRFCWRWLYDWELPDGRADPSWSGFDQEMILFQKPTWW